MGNGRLRLLRAIPGSTSLRPIVRDFCRKGHGMVTAFSDNLLPLCKEEVGEDSLIDVLQFGEVVRRYLERTGEEALFLATGQHATAAVAEACMGVGEESPFRRGARFPGVHEAVLRTLKELHDWGLFDAGLARLAEGASPRLAAKLASLADIDAEVGRVLGLLGRTTSGRQLRDCLEGAAELDGEFQRLLVIVGSEDSPQKARWLRWAADNGTDVTAVLYRHAAGGALFAGADRTLGRLGQEADEVGEANVLLKRLFGDPAATGPELAVTISSAPDKLAECEWALRTLAAAGTLSRSAIYVRNLDEYAPLLEAAAKRFKVPLRMARRAPLLTNAFARLTLQTLEFVASQDVRTLASATSCSYLGLSADERIEMGDALREAHRQRGTQWSALQTWAAEHADRFPWLSQILDWRATRLSEVRTMADWVGQLRNLIDALPWQDVADATAYETDRDTRAQSQLLRSLAGPASVQLATEAPRLTLGAFVERCRVLWAASDVSLPFQAVGVSVTQQPEMIGEADTLVVMGMLEGIFPRRRTEDPILSDDDRLEINSLRPGEPALRTSRDAAIEERDAFYQVCSGARRTLAFSYPQADDEQDNVPAFYLEAIRGIAEVEAFDRPRSDLGPADSPFEADRALRSALESEKVDPPSAAIVTDGARAVLKRGRDEPVTPRQIQDAIECPFRQVAGHRLGLRPTGSSERWRRLQHLPGLATLSLQPDREHAEAAMEQALASQLDAWFADVPAWELRLLETGGRRLIRQWVDREFQSRLLWPRQPDHGTGEVRFGTPPLRDELWDGVKLDGSVAGVSWIGDTAVAHLCLSSLPNGNGRQSVGRGLATYLDVHLAALYQPNLPVALDIETMGARRVLYRPYRPENNRLGQSADGLQLQYATEGEQTDPLRGYFNEVKKAVAEAAANIREGAIEPKPDEHCQSCAYGELCRRHVDYGEESSPFGSEAGDA